MASNLYGIDSGVITKEDAQKIMDDFTKREHGLSFWYAHPTALYLKEELLDLISFTYNYKQATQKPETILVGYGEDWTGATRKYKILAETTDGKYVVEDFDTITKLGIHLIDRSTIKLERPERCQEAKHYEAYDWCQYLKRVGDAPGWCKEADHPCSRELGEDCYIKEYDE